MSMKIVSCATDLGELEPLAEAGADEFYTAVRELPAFGFGFLPYACLGPAIKKAHALGKKIALAVNAVCAPAMNGSLSDIVRRIRTIDDMGIDAFIFSSPYFLGTFSGRKTRLRAQLHLSSVQPVFNSLSAAFFARYGAARIILPNQLAPAEAEKILALCRDRGIETEIFNYRFFGCAYINGRCQLHQPVFYNLKTELPKGSLCRVSAERGGLVRVKSLELPERSGEVLGVMSRLSSRLAGGGAPRLSNAAAFFDFLTAGVQYLKYGTRHDPSAVKIKKVAETRRMLELALKFSSSLPRAKARKAFLTKMSGWVPDRF